MRMAPPRPILRRAAAPGQRGATPDRDPGSRSRTGSIESANCTHGRLRSHIPPLGSKDFRLPLNKKTLSNDGFTGFRPISDLDINRIPQRQGIFAVLRPADYEPRFLAASTAGTFKKKKPTLPAAALAAEWVPDADVLFIGRAGSGSKGNRGLRRQIAEFVDFGRGKPPGHWDGRLIWQLAHAEDLLMAWRELPADDVSAAQAHYQAEFLQLHGRLPFANLVLTRPRGVRTAGEPGVA